MDLDALRPDKQPRLDQMAAPVTPGNASPPTPMGTPQRQESAACSSPPQRATAYRQPTQEERQTPQGPQQAPESPTYTKPSQMQLNEALIQARRRLPHLRTGPYGKQ